MAAAVLETAGYKTQEYILGFMSQHLRATGTLLYVISVLLALLIIGLFGKYKWGAYLILGPTLFYFLVGYSGPVSGTVWRLGSSTPRLPNGPAQSEAEAVAAMRDLAPQAMGNGDINVAFPFKVYTQVVDKLIKMLVSTILPLKDRVEQEKNLLFANRAYALETLLGSKMDHPQLLQMFNGDYLISCKTMMDAAINLANPDLTLARRNQILSERAAASNPRTIDLYNKSVDTIDRMRIQYTEQWDAGRTMTVNPGAAVRQFMTENQGNAAAAPAVQAFLTSRGAANVEALTELTMTCEQLWNIVADAVVVHSMPAVEALRDTYASQINLSDRGILCIDLAKKLNMVLTPADATACEERYLVTLAGTFMLRNAIADLSSSRALTKMKNDMEFIASDKRGTVFDHGEDAEDWNLISDPISATPSVSPGAFMGQNGNVFAFQRSKNGSDIQRMGLYENKKDGSKMWRPVTVLRSDVLGNFDAVFVEHQRYQTTELRQKVFSFALNLPYYQGVLLYLLAVGYPFFALTVIIPGRGGAFLNFLLAWLWVKSWDVGFAVLMVLEKILWNLFPGQDFNGDFIGRRKISEQALPQLITEVFKVDPSYNVHGYYFFLSIAAFGIPTICGYATLKLRKGMVMAVSEGITNKLNQGAQDKGQTASGGYGMTIMNMRTSAQKEISGAALLSIGLDERDWQGQQPYFAKAGAARQKAAHQWASEYADSVTRASVAQMRFSDTALQNIDAKRDRIHEVAYQSMYAQMLRVETSIDAMERRIFHGTFGRFGRLQLMSDAAHAALDGSGGFEIYEMTTVERLFATRIAAAQTKFRLRSEIQGYEKGLEVIDDPARSPELGLLDSIRRMGMTGQKIAQDVIFERGNQEFLEAVRYTYSDFERLRETGETDLEKRLEATGAHTGLITAYKQAFTDWIEQKKRLEGLSDSEMERYLSSSIDPDKISPPLVPFFDLPDPLSERSRAQNPEKLRILDN